MLTTLFLFQLTGRRTFLVKKRREKECRFHSWAKLRGHTLVTVTLGAESFSSMTALEGKGGGVENSPNGKTGIFEDGAVA